MQTREFRKRIRDSIDENVRFKEKLLDPLAVPGTVLIVGQNPGRQRRNERTQVVWEGNRSADLVNWILDGQRNVYLTNVCNYQKMTPERIEEGVHDLSVLIITLQPSVIVCLGAFAHLAVAQLEMSYPVRKLLHPSYIVRFNKDREEYKRRFLSAMDRL